MKFRFSILNLLLLTTVIALSIAVVQISGDLKEERRLRTELLQKGGIFEISDVTKVHVVPVHATNEMQTYRWRVYVPPGRSIILNTSSKPHPNRDILEPRICRKDSVVSDRNPSNPIEIPAGEYVITYKYHQSTYGQKQTSFSIDVRGNNSVRRQGFFRSNDGDLDWLSSNYYQDLTWLERPAGKKQRITYDLAKTSQVAGGKPFVLFRFRATQQHKSEHDSEKDKSIPEVFAWFMTDWQRIV
jgi:hypothetical protein